MASQFCHILAVPSLASSQLPEPQFPQQQNGDGNGSHLAGLLGELNWKMHSKHSAQIFALSRVSVSVGYDELLSTGHDLHGDNICIPHSLGVSRTQTCA